MFWNNNRTFRALQIIIGCVPLGWSGSGSVIRDHSDHGRSSEWMNPLWTRIHQFIWSTRNHPNDLRSLILIQVISKECTHYLKYAVQLSPSSRSRNRLCRRTAISTLFWSSRKHNIEHKQCSRLLWNYWIQPSPQDLNPSVNNNMRYSLAKSITGCIKFTKRAVIWIILTAQWHFWTPWLERTHCMENEQSVFFLTPHTPFGHTVYEARACEALTLLLLYSKTVLRKKNRLFCSLPKSH